MDMLTVLWVSNATIRVICGFVIPTAIKIQHNTGLGHELQEQLTTSFKTEFPL